MTTHLTHLILQQLLPWHLLLLLSSAIFILYFIIDVKLFQEALNSHFYGSQGQSGDNGFEGPFRRDRGAHQAVGTEDP